MPLTTENKQDALVLQRQLDILAEKTNDFDAKLLLTMASTMVWAVAKDDSEMNTLAKFRNQMCNKKN